MINRLVEPFRGRDDDVPDGDYWEVWSEGSVFYVSPDTARRVLQALERRPPRWIRFADIFGSEVGIRSRDVQRVSESTRSQRASERRFRRARREESNADRRPGEEDDDWW